MRQFNYFVYMEQEDLNNEIPTYTGKIFSLNRTQALNTVEQMFPYAYYLYCI